MKCTDVRAALPLLIYGEANPQDAALWEHLAACPTCRRDYEALANVRRLLDDAAAPRIAVDLPQLHRALAERQMQRARRWRRLAVALGGIAALLLLAIGLRLEIRLEATQLVVRWGNPPPVGQAFQPDLRDDLRVLSDLIHALKQDADDRDQRCEERLDHLEKHVRALRSQADLRWNATEKNVAALYLLSRKGEKP